MYCGQLKVLDTLSTMTALVIIAVLGSSYCAREAKHRTGRWTPPVHINSSDNSQTVTIKCISDLKYFRF